MRFYISGTFCDMQEERQLIHGHVMANLRSFCDARRLSVSFVDVRHGCVEGTGVVTDRVTADSDQVCVGSQKVSTCSTACYHMLLYVYSHTLTDRVTPDLRLASDVSRCVFAGIGSVCALLHLLAGPGVCRVSECLELFYCMVSYRVKSIFAHPAQCRNSNCTCPTSSACWARCV